MQYPVRFDGLVGYPFERLRALLSGVTPGGDVVRLTIGEPKHRYPKWIAKELGRHEALFNVYPKNNGLEEWVYAVGQYLERVHDVKSVAADHLTPLSGTREGLYIAALALFAERKNKKKPKVLIPNPYYPAYLMGALTLGLAPYLVDATLDNGFLPDYAALPAAVLDSAVAVFLSSPSNPQGAVADEAYLKNLITLAEKHDFLIVADECYAEIYYDKKPPSALAVAQNMGADLNRVIIFHSLSKRSNVPGLRSGFAASGPKTMRRFQELRAYVGAPVPGPIQMLSARLWSDDLHVEKNREKYQAKLQDVKDILAPSYLPAGGFFLWYPVQDGARFTKTLWAHTGIEVLPGAYLAQTRRNKNPGQDYVRIALVEKRKKTQSALRNIADFRAYYDETIKTETDGV